MQRAGGRFFSYNENLACYEDQCFKDSVTKTSQALREDQRIVKEKIRANLASRTLTNVPPRSVKFWTGCSESLFKALFDGCNPEMLPAMISAHIRIWYKFMHKLQVVNFYCRGKVYL